MEPAHEDQQNQKKRDLKETQKNEEEKDAPEMSPNPESTPGESSGTHKTAKKVKEHTRTEIWAVPPTQEEIDERFKGSYLEEMKFAPFKPLTEVEGRLQCPKCKSNRKFFCFTCFVPLLKDIPQVQLPVNFTVLKHPGEKMAKSSIIASKIISPESVEINNSLEVPDFDYDRTILLFPKEDSVPVTSMTKEDLSKINTVVLIDSTWLQVNKFLVNEKVAKLKPVVINTERTIFWRYQRGITDKNLSTIEAMYFFMRDYDKVMAEQEYDGKYDNLLYFYAYNYALIQNEYKKGLKKERNFHKIQGYIKDGEKKEAQEEKQE